LPAGWRSYYTNKIFYLMEAKAAKTNKKGEKIEI